MASSTSNLDLISSGQAQKEITANALFDAASPSLLFGRRANTTEGLTWGYYGGFLTGVTTEIPNGTVTLLPNSLNYISSSLSGVVSVSTTSYGDIPLYAVRTNSLGVASGEFPTGGYQDRRQNPLTSGASYSLPQATTTTLGGVKIDNSTIVINSSTGVISVAPSGGALTNFNEAKKTGYTWPINSLTANGVETNLDVAIVSKGLGGFTLSVPDGTAANGAKIGSSAINLQISTTATSQGAVGSNSGVFGQNNRAADQQSYCFGLTNQSLNVASHCYGSNNVCSGRYAVSLGTSNSTTNTSSFAAGSYNNVSGHSGFGIGNYCVANAANSFVTGSYSSSKAVIGAFAYAVSNFSTPGDAQYGQYILRTLTSAAGTKALSTDGAGASSSNIVALQNNEARAFRGLVIMKDSGNTGAAAAWEVKGAIQRFATAASTIFIGTPVVTSLGISSLATTNGYAINLIADATFGGLRIECVYTAGGVVKVVAEISCAEVI